MVEPPPNHPLEGQHIERPRHLVLRGSIGVLVIVVVWPTVHQKPPEDGVAGEDVILHGEPSLQVERPEEQCLSKLAQACAVVELLLLARECQHGEPHIVTCKQYLQISRCAKPKSDSDLQLVIT